MVLPKQTITVLDPGLGLVEPAADSPVYIGTSSAGTVDTLYSFSALNTIRSTLGYGPLAEDVAKALRERGGPVLAVKAAGSVAATTTAVVQTGGGPLVTLAGVATDRFTGRITVMKGGALGVAEFVHTLDNHDSAQVTPTSGTQRLIPAGGTFLMPFLD
jgi:hypothetical protein